MIAKTLKTRTATVIVFKLIEFTSLHKKAYRSKPESVKNTTTYY